MSSRISGLSVIAPNYKGVLCDVWGVLHNGVGYFESAAEALRAFRKESGPVILVTNAPRPNAPIKTQLERLGIPADSYDDVVTSGDVTRTAILETGKTKLLHLGPERDLPLFDGLDVTLVGEEEAEIVCCTGLLNETRETPDDYDDMLQSFARRNLPFICANPDRIVQKGAQIFYCAGALADRFEAYGGETTFVGKPEAPIYAASMAALEKASGQPVDRSDVLIIGDSLPTDMRGGHYQKIDALFISSGIHAADFGPSDAPDDAKVNLRLTHEDVETVAWMPRLCW
ncbi:HAD-superfamily class IIA hydrolase, TIGR01459 [Cohaesibacter sp. ES.047]|uniref:TIGR01459 family HAD-type hydrolase n=1 Tax=Cohaesibacter sp. ES.047 TaxID=1798205 RepID=UPI000BB751D8|nr:TIGR01459 family HAD-type hydrolase [Cohaesibacter sp. ES.047]SNY92465.1 HAD-superfamily class IIA hydrolase, TIGR01459 [Cohaesibacter sp. ES.047]